MDTENNYFSGFSLCLPDKYDDLRRDESEIEYLTLDFLWRGYDWRRYRRSLCCKWTICFFIGLNRSLRENLTLTEPQLGQTFSLPYHVGSSSNYQDIFPIIYQHDLWCKRWNNPCQTHKWFSRSSAFRKEYYYILICF